MLSQMKTFLGYSSVSKAYRVFNKRTFNVEESIHIIFDETDLLCKPTDPVEISKQLSEVHLDDVSDEEEITFKRTLQSPEPNVCDQPDEAVGIQLISLLRSRLILFRLTQSTHCQD